MLKICCSALGQLRASGGDRSLPGKIGYDQMGDGVWYVAWSTWGLKGIAIRETAA